MSDVYLLTKHFYDTAARHSSKPALMEKMAGTYRSMTYQQMKEKVEQVAAFLISSGFEPQARMALLSENRPEWPIADMGMISAGMVCVPIYPTSTPHQISYILNDCGATAICVSRPLQLNKVVAIYKNSPQLRLVVVMEDYEPVEMGAIRIISFKHLLEEGRSADGARLVLQQRLQQARESDLVSIVYTSGTTGDPKGVMLSHRNFASNARAAIQALKFTSDETTLSFLPLSHVLERVVHYALQYCGATIAYAESIDTISQNLGEVRPSAFVGVPRVLEKIYNRVIQSVESDKPLKKKIFYWALEVGKQYAYKLTQKQPIPTLLAAQYRLADKLVFKKIQARTGGNLKFAISGGAPLMREIAEFFFAIGIPIYEGYGLTETSPVICVNRPGAIRFGSVGQTIEDVEITLAEDGGILARGPNIMQGDYHKPEATAEVLGEDGWFHTGDIGLIDADGFLTITDRKKEILVMSNGKNVAPQPIENTLKTSPYIEQAVLLGNNQKYIAALVYPNYELLAQYAKDKGSQAQSPVELAQDAQVLAFLRLEMDRLTADFARFEHIKKFALLTEEITEASGLLTPSLKYKRRVINERYQQQIADLFADAAVL
jgi:long-chain acyl-CoA synthetase